MKEKYSHINKTLNCKHALVKCMKHLFIGISKYFAISAKADENWSDY